MKNCTIEKELVIQTPNKQGTVADVAEICSHSKANIKAMWAGAMNDRGTFAIITDDNSKVQQALSQHHYKDVRQHDVVVVRVPDQMGKCAEVAHRISEAGLNIDSIYTTQFEGKPAIVVSTNDNPRAAKLFN